MYAAILLVLLALFGSISIFAPVEDIRFLGWLAFLFVLGLLCIRFIYRLLTGKIITFGRAEA